MLKSTFTHIPGVGETVQNKLENSGIKTWDDFIEQHENIPLNTNKKKYILSYIKQSKKALKKKDHKFFSNLKTSLHWKAYPYFKDDCCFLDIETTGLSKYLHDVTIIGLYDGTESKILINGKNLDEFENEIKKHKMLVTFNGRCFDVPFLQSKFPNVKFDHFHIDLRFLLSSLGYTGGLKRIEKQLGIQRDDDLQEVDGWEAVRLWKKYQKGDKDALKLLIKYNQADIENLKILMELAYEMKITSLPSPIKSKNTI